MKRVVEWLRERHQGVLDLASFAMLVTLACMACAIAAAWGHRRGVASVKCPVCPSVTAEKRQEASEEATSTASSASRSEDRDVKVVERWYRTPCGGSQPVLAAEKTTEDRSKVAEAKAETVVKIVDHVVTVEKEVKVPVEVLKTPVFGLEGGILTVSDALLSPELEVAGRWKWLRGSFSMDPRDPGRWTAGLTAKLLEW